MTTNIYSTSFPSNSPTSYSYSPSYVPSFVPSQSPNYIPSKMPGQIPVQNPSYLSSYSPNNVTNQSLENSNSSSTDYNTMSDIRSLGPEFRGQASDSFNPSASERSTIYNDVSQLDQTKLLNHPHVNIACKALGIHKCWINTNLFYIWPMNSLTNDVGVSYDIKCGYVFASFKAIVIDVSDHELSKTKPNSFIYFYGKCVVNPQAPSEHWQFENWGWKSIDKPTNIITRDRDEHRDRTCCWGFC